MVEFNKNEKMKKQTPPPKEAGNEKAKPRDPQPEEKQDPTLAEEEFVRKARTW